jgi:hypothetical protein
MSKERICNNVLKTPLYGNCRVQNPQGVHIFNCGEKKVKWYLKRGLAEIIQNTPLIIRLNFMPNGQGHTNDDYYLQERENICVCCGTNKEITRHHIVPIMYRKHFPDCLKNHTAYDVLPLCYECHEKYEVAAQQLKKELAKEHSVLKNNTTIIDPALKKICLYATAILKQPAIPPVRYKMMMDAISSYYGHVITIEDLEKASQVKYNTRRKDYRSEGQLIVEQLSDVEEFVKLWRQHFVTHTKPAHLPQHWTVDRPLK